MSGKILSGAALMLAVRWMRKVSGLAAATARTTAAIKATIMRMAVIMTVPRCCFCSYDERWFARSTQIPKNFSLVSDNQTEEHYSDYLVTAAVGVSKSFGTKS